jgi:SAM-dependent methyltransferase
MGAGMSSSTQDVPEKFYSSDFYADQSDASAVAASVVVPIVLELTAVNSVVDVGCGVGTWVAEFFSRGVRDVCGIDGDYVNRAQLRIPSEKFLARDLTQTVRLDRTVDLAVCLEVAEHLPESRAKSLVADLTSLAPCVLFSAAVPGQGGTNHINEQFLSYWIELFKANGYTGIDPIRPRILGNKLVGWWYQQNIVMFVAPGHPLLNNNYASAKDFVHLYLYERFRSTPGLKLLVSNFIANFPGAFQRSFRCYFERKRRYRARRMQERADAAQTARAK